MSRPLFFLFLFTFLPPTFSQDDHRLEWTLNETYDGPHQAEYNELRWKIPTLVRQTVINLSAKLGVPYNEGWRYPLEIGFVDSTPGGTENILAYVQLWSSPTQGIKQRLNINLQAYKDQGFDFEAVLAHELVHAMMNDSLGAYAASVFPIWLHEGLAVYGADQGEKMVKSYVYKYSGFAYRKMINGLEGPHTGLDYAEDYWAIKYIYEQHGQNSLHNFVREVIERKGDIPGALEYTCFESWDDFQESVKAFAKEEIEDIGPAKRGRHENPY